MSWKGGRVRAACSVQRALWVGRNSRSTLSPLREPGPPSGGSAVQHPNNARAPGRREHARPLSCLPRRQARVEEKPRPRRTRQCIRLAQRACDAQVWRSSLFLSAPERRRRRLVVDRGARPDLEPGALFPAVLLLLLLLRRRAGGGARCLFRRVEVQRSCLGPFRRWACCGRRVATAPGPAGSRRPQRGCCFCGRGGFRGRRQRVAGRAEGHRSLSRAQAPRPEGPDDAH